MSSKDEVKGGKDRDLECGRGNKMEMTAGLHSRDDIGTHAVNSTAGIPIIQNISKDHLPEESLLHRKEEGKVMMKKTSSFYKSKVRDAAQSDYYADGGTGGEINNAEDGPEGEGSNAGQVYHQMEAAAHQDSVSYSSSKNSEWVRNSFDYVRRLTFEEMVRRSRDWKQLKSSEWSTWGQWLFFAGFILLFSCLGTLIWKLAYIDFFLYKMNEDKQFINHDLQQIIQDERSGRSFETDYEPIIRRTCSTANIRFILSLIICCILSAVGFLLICCGLSGITVEVEENKESIDEGWDNRFRNSFVNRNRSCQSPDLSQQRLIQASEEENFPYSPAPQIYPIFENVDNTSSSIDNESLKSAKSYFETQSPSYIPEHSTEIKKS